MTLINSRDGFSSHTISKVRAASGELTAAAKVSHVSDNTTKNDVDAFG